MKLERFNIFDEVEKINEVFIDSKRKLRDAVHDIVTELEPGNEISYEDICKRLKQEFNINISVNLFDKIIDNWWVKRDYKIFKEKDRKWLDPWIYRKTIERKVKTNKVLGKGRKKAEREEREKEWKNRSINYPRHGGGQYRQGTLWDDRWIW